MAGVERTGEAEPSAPVDSRRSTDLAVGLSMANVGFYSASIGVVLVVLAAEFGVAAVRLSWLGSAFGYGLIALAVLGPYLLSRLGARGVLRLAGVVLAAGGLLLVLAPAEWAAYAGAILQGLGAAGMVLVAPGLLHGSDAAVRLTRVNAVASVVAIAAPLLFGLAATIGIGARMPVLLVVVVSIGLVVVARSVESPRAGPAAGSEQSRPSTALALRRWLVIVCAVSAEFAFVVWGVARLVSAGLDLGWAAAAGASFQLGMAGGRLVGPRLIGRIPILMVGAGLAAAGTLVVALVPLWPLVAAGQLLAGLGIAPMYPVALGRLMGTPRLRPELGASLGALASGVAITVAPTALAALALVVDLRLAFLVLLPLLALVVLLHHEPRTATR